MLRSAAIRPVTSRLPLALVLLGLSALFWALEQSTYSLGFGLHYLLAGLGVAWYLRLLLRDNAAATMTSFYQIFYGVGMLASAALISNGAVMIEINATGTANGVFWIMLIFFVIGMEATVLGYGYGHLVRLPARALRLPAGFDLAIMIFIILPVLAMAIYVFLLTGGPVLRGVDRVTFWRSIAPAETKMLPTLMRQFFFFVAFFYLWRARAQGSMVMMRIGLIGYLLAGLFVLGEKFSLFVVLLNIWLIVQIGVVPEFRFKPRHFVGFAVVMALILLVVAITYIADEKNIGFILVRVALQAQLLWSVAESALDGVSQPWRPECIFGCDFYSNGRDYISYRYLASGIYNFYREGGSTLSGFMPALPIFTLGPVLAMMLHVFVGIVLGVLQRKTTTAVRKRQSIYSFLIFKMQFSITVIWFAAIETAIPGLLLVVAAIIIYRLAGILQTGRSANYAHT